MSILNGLTAKYEPQDGHIVMNDNWTLSTKTYADGTVIIWKRPKPSRRLTSYTLAIHQITVDGVKFRFVGKADRFHYIEGLGPMVSDRMMDLVLSSWSQ